MIRLITLFSVLLMYLNSFSSPCDTTYIKPKFHSSISLFQDDVIKFFETNDDTYLSKWSTDTFYVHFGENIYYGLHCDISPMFVEFLSRYPMTTRFLPFIRNGKSQVMICYKAKVGNIIETIYIVFELNDKSVIKNIYIY